MSVTIIRPKSHAEWLKHRESGIGSSEVGTILGLSPWETPYQLWRRKKGLDTPAEENFVMKAGHYLEDAVSMFYHDATGDEIIKSSKGDWLAVCTEKPYMRVSPDRTFWVSGAPHKAEYKGILECKTTQMDIDEDDLPKHWLCQLQYQLGVTGMRHGALAWLTQGRKFGYRQMVFDKEFFDYIVEEVERFWIDNIQGDREPLSMSIDDVTIKFPQSTDGKIITADEGIMTEIEELQKIKESIKDLSTRKAQLEKDVKLYMGDAEALVTDSLDKPLATWKTDKDRRSFDVESFKHDYPQLYDKYSVFKEGNRKLLIK